MSWQQDAADLIPCDAGCPSREGIRAHSEGCQDQRDVALAFIGRLVNRAQAAAVGQVTREARKCWHLVDAGLLTPTEALHVITNAAAADLRRVEAENHRVAVAGVTS